MQIEQNATSGGVDDTPAGKKVGLDRLTVVSLAGTAAVLVAVVLLFTVPGLEGLATAGYDTMFSAMNYMAEMCRF